MDELDFSCNFWKGCASLLDFDLIWKQEFLYLHFKSAIYTFRRGRLYSSCV